MTHLELIQKDMLSFILQYVCVEACVKNYREYIKLWMIIEIHTIPLPGSCCEASDLYREK